MSSASLNKTFPSFLFCGVKGQDHSKLLLPSFIHLTLQAHVSALSVLPTIRLFPGRGGCVDDLHHRSAHRVRRHRSNVHRSTQSERQCRGTRVAEVELAGRPHFQFVSTILRKSIFLYIRKSIFGIYEKAFSVLRKSIFGVYEKALSVITKKHFRYLRNSILGIYEKAFSVHLSKNGHLQTKQNLNLILKFSFLKFNYLLLLILLFLSFIMIILLLLLIFYYYYYYYYNIIIIYSYIIIIIYYY